MLGSYKVRQMDLQKMHPMARKLGVHTEEFTKALENDDVMVAQQHLNEIKKFAEFLSDDIFIAIKKAEEQVTHAHQSHVNGVVLRKMNETGAKFDSAQRDRVLPGVIIPARTGGGMRKHSGTFGRYSN